MARRRIPKGQINRKNKQTIKALTNLMEDLNQKYSIRVGIIGEKAYEQHPHTDLTNAQLGAIHEFGATINVTEKMRGYLHSIGIHLRGDTTSIVIPTRSFLRMPLLSGEFKEYLMTKATLDDKDRELNKELALYRMDKAPEYMKTLAEFIGGKALERVQTAFQTSGLGNWAPISQVTKDNRQGGKDNPPLDDTGQLMDSITVEVKKVK